MANGKILVADDERHIVRLLEVYLQRADYEVVTAADGQECLEKVASEKPNLVILDIIMPKLDGLQVLKELRQEEATENLPVIVHTNRGQDKDVFEGYHNGADMYLVKPQSQSQLLYFVRRMLGQDRVGDI